VRGAEQVRGKNKKREPILPPHIAPTEDVQFVRTPPSGQAHAVEEEKLAIGMASEGLCAS
jgi:hypothetical protein